MMDFYESLDTLLQQSAHRPKSENIDSARACGRILAADIQARYDAPLFDNSAMDGYAVCGLDVQQWTLAGLAAAGDSQTHQLHSGQAMRIFTGAGLPENTDAVIPQENAEGDGHFLRTTANIKPEQHIRRCGEEFHRGDILLHGGTLLTPQAIGLAASQGLAELPCFAPITVTVLTTGDELVAATPAAQELGNNQIFDSNRPMLLTMLGEQRFVNVQNGGILPDDLDATIATLQKAAAHSDAVVISGGASVGERDYVKPALSRLGEIEHWKLAIKPGKPFGWGHIRACKVMLLPGNPVASFVTFRLLGLAALKSLAGMHTLQALPECHQARAGFSLVPNQQQRREFLRGTMHFTAEGPVVKPLAQQGSHMLSGCVQASVLIDVPAQTDIHEGQWLTIYPI